MKGEMCTGDPTPTRVRLLRTTDEYTRLVPGTEGTITGVDKLGTLQVRWDDGSTLGLVPGEDEWEVIEP